jgi:hypothetical protein
MRYPSRQLVSTSLCVILSAFAGLNGCESNTGRGAAAGGAGGAITGGAAAGAAAGAPAAGVGAVAGAAIGATAGAILGSAKDRTEEQRARATAMSQRNPALASAVVSGGNADLNDDGFVTTDEIIAMHKAGLSDQEIIARSRSTQQIFQLSTDQERYLVESGVRPSVVMQLRTLNDELRDPGVIKQDRVDPAPYQR